MSHYFSLLLKYCVQCSRDNELIIQSKDSSFGNILVALQSCPSIIYCRPILKILWLFYIKKINEKAQRSSPWLVINLSPQNYNPQEKIKDKTKVISEYIILLICDNYSEAIELAFPVQYYIIYLFTFKIIKMASQKVNINLFEIWCV